jgi:hypothetical protein
MEGSNKKSFGKVGHCKKLQPLTQPFGKSEHLGMYMGHSRTSGAVCDPTAFDGVVGVRPGILGPKHGTVGIDLVEPGYEDIWDNSDDDQRRISERSL